MELFAPFIALIASVIIARLINERSYRLLTPEHKAGLFDLFSKYRIYGFIFIAVIIFMLFGLPYLHILSYTATVLLSIGIFLIFSIILSLFMSKKLIENGYPRKFIMMYILSMAVRFGGLALFLLVFIFYRRLFG